MEPKNSETWEEDMYWKHFHFARFSLILPHDFHHRLMLPKKFTDHLRAQLPDKIILKFNGITWNVNLEKGKDDVMFQGDGWREFAKAYSLKKADMLMFKYDRRECFEVLLFDQASSCEIEASYFVRKGEQPNSNDHDDSCGEAKETAAEEFVDRNQQVNASAYTLRNQHNKNYDENDEDEQNGTFDEENSNSDEDCTTRTAYAKRAREVSSNPRKRSHKVAEKTTPKRKRPCLVTYKSNRRPVTEEEKEKALETARETCTQYRNSFIVVMRPSSVYSRFHMSIPKEWQMRHVFKKGQEVVLKMKEKTWVCRVVTFTRNHKGFEGGWKSFARENALEEFDVCLFVPTGSKDGKPVMDVSIFRVVPEVVRPSIVTPSDEIQEISSEDISQGDDSDYAQRNRHRKNSDLTPKYHFSGRAAKNREEDCMPVKGADAIEVLFSSSWKNRNSTPKENGAYTKASARQITQADKEWILKMAKETAAKHKNSFIQIMRPSTVDGRYFMSIPATWKQRRDLRKGQEVILRVKEKEWVCTFCLSASNKGLQAGWKHFVHDNKLEKFDVCMFVPAELKKGKLVLDVSIFRVRHHGV